jgi:hypothetical protein
VDDAQTEPREIAFQDVECIYLSDDRAHRRTLVNTAMNVWFPQKAGDFLVCRTIRSRSPHRNSERGTESKETGAVTTLP